MERLSNWLKFIQLVNDRAKVRKCVLCYTVLDMYRYCIHMHTFGGQVDLMTNMLGISISLNLKISIKLSQSYLINIYRKFENFSKSDTSHTKLLKKAH